MPTFDYKAVTEDGSPIKGSLEADSESTAAGELHNKGYFPLSVTRRRDLLKKNINIFDRVRLDDIVFFTRQLHAIVKSGVPLLTGLTALEQQVENNLMKQVIADIRKDVDHGRKFSAALSKHPKIFQEVYVSMVDMGEASGNLDEVLPRLVRSLEFDRKTRTNLKAALRYPTFVVLALCGAFLVLITKVVPKFAGIFARSKVELPLPTRMLLGLSSCIQEYYYLTIAVLFLLVASFILYIRTKRGRINFDHFKMKIPILGPIFVKIYASRFCGTIETLIRTGISIDVALDITARNVGNAYIALKIEGITDKVKKGLGLARSLQESGIFPPLVLQMVATGEESGSLDDLLMEVTEYYEREVDYTVSRLSSYIEPILTVGLAAMVLFMALAIFLPMWDSMRITGLKK
ncbi:MAG: type II secretion system F family protein [Pseudomonadota bacterium]